MGNFPGPYQLRFFYNTGVTGSAAEHVLALNLDLQSDPGAGQAMSTYTALLRSGGTKTCQQAASDFITLLRPLFSTAATFIRTELWKYAPGTNNAQFYSTLASGLAGTGVSGGQAAVQQIYVFRTLGGGSFRITLVEGTRTSGTFFLYTDLDANEKALVDAIVATTNWAIGRDNTFPFGFIRMYPGQNERLFKDYFR